MLEIEAVWTWNRMLMHGPGLILICHCHGSWVNEPISRAMVVIARFEVAVGNLGIK
jgi:hypothetical protein